MLLPGWPRLSRSRRVTSSRRRYVCDDCEQGAEVIFAEHELAHAQTVLQAPRIALIVTLGGLSYAADMLGAHQIRPRRQRNAHSPHDG